MWTGGVDIQSVAQYCLVLVSVDIGLWMAEAVWYNGNVLIVIHDMRLFVYGTLMQGMRNHEYLKDAQFLGVATTGPEFELLTNGSIPAARWGNEPISGELYEVSDVVLEGLDVLEEVNSKLYERAEATISGEKAIVYLGSHIFANDSWQKVPGGDWKAFQQA